MYIVLLHKLIFYLYFILRVFETNLKQTSFVAFIVIFFNLVNKPVLAHNCYLGENIFLFSTSGKILKHFTYKVKASIKTYRT